MDKDDPLIIRRSTINPYLQGAGSILGRLMWDIHIQSWISRRQLHKWKNKHKGDKAIILCNGPSLNKVDLSCIDEDIFTFGLNKINLLFDYSDFRPSCIVAVNPFVIEQNRDFFNTTKIPLFIDSCGIQKKWLKARNNVSFLHSASHSNGFARDCSMSINQGHTVTFVALQLAFYFGFNEVALVGADHTFATQGPANKTVDGESVDKSHFDSRYFANVQWQLPDLFESEVAYTRARKIYEAHDRKVYNCSINGKLEVFDRMELKEFLTS